jgi:hypothetical protein
LSRCTIQLIKIISRPSSQEVSTAAANQSIITLISKQKIIAQPPV